MRDEPNTAWTPPGATPPPQPPAVPPGTPFIPPVYENGRTNRLAIVSLATGLFGISPVAVATGIAALVQIRRRREQGKAMAIAGIVTGVTWLVASIVIIGAIMSAGSTPTTLKLRPEIGDCFDIVDDTTHPVTGCERPHDAELITTFDVSEQAWPGEDAIFRLGLAGCEERFLHRYQTRMPIEMGEPYVFYPRRVNWRVGDRKIHCAIAVTKGNKLTAPIGDGPHQFRALADLKRGDCFATPKTGATATRIMNCDAPHDAQVTHRFELPDGAYPGDKAIEESADSGCGTRWDKMFAKKRPPVRTEQWYLTPTKESWGFDDRVVHCYLTGPDGRRLDRSVVPK